MTKTKKPKSGRCGFFRVLAAALKKKRSSDDDDVIAEGPFASPHDVSEAKQPAIEKTSSESPASPKDKHKAAVKTLKKTPKETPIKAPKSPVTDLDKVKRELGLTNNEFAKDKLKIRPNNKRAPTKYADLLDPGSGSLDRSSEDLVSIHADISGDPEKPLLVGDNKKGKDSVTSDSDGRTTDGSINELERIGDSAEKSGRTAHVIKKPSVGKVEGKMGARLPRTNGVDHSADGSVDGATPGAKSVLKTASTVHQLKSDDSISREKAKASEKISLEDESTNSNPSASISLESSDGMSQSVKGRRKLPRTFLDAGESGGLPSESSVTTEGDVRQTPNAEISASGGSLDSVETGLRGSRRRSSKVVRADSTAKHPADHVDEKSKNRNSGIGDLRRENTKTKADLKEMGFENEAGRIRGSTKKRREEKAERKTRVGFADEISAENGIIKDADDKTVASEKTKEDIWNDVDQNEDLSSSLKTDSPDSSFVYHDGRIPSEKSKEARPKRGVKDLPAVPVIPQKSSIKGRGVKTGQQQTTSEANETSTRGQSPDVEGSKEIDKAFQKVGKKSSSDVVTDASRETKRVNDGARPASVEQNASKDGDAKPAELRSIRKKTQLGDPTGINRAESQRRFDIEHRGSKTRLRASHSRDSSAVDGEGKAASEDLDGEKKGNDLKTAESAAATIDAGKTSFKASGEGATNEIGEAFKKIKTKQSLPNAPSDNVAPSQSTGLKDVDGVVAQSSEKIVSGSGSSLKPTKSFTTPRAEPIVVLGRSLKENHRKVGGDFKSAESNSVANDDKKPTMVTAETDKVTAVDGDGGGGSSQNKSKLPPAPPVAKRTGRVQPKPAESEKEVAWVGMARRMSKDLGEKVLHIEAKNEERKSGNEVITDENFERGGVRTSVKELIKKMQQKNHNG